MSVLERTKHQSILLGQPRTGHVFCVCRSCRASVPVLYCVRRFRNQSLSAFAIVIQAGLGRVRGKEILPSPVDKSSRLVKDEEKASYDKLPLSLTEAVECAKKSAFLQNSPCKDIANRFIEVIEQEAM